MKKRAKRILSILLGLILLNIPFFVSGQTLPTSSTGEVEKLTADDIALHIFENGTSSIHVRKANKDYKYALLNSAGNSITDWQEPKEGRVIFDGQDVNKDYSVVFCPDIWAGDASPERWAPTGIHFNIPDFDDAIDKTFVNPQDVERSKDRTIIWIYSTHSECEYALYEFYTDHQITPWKDGVAGVVVFTDLKPYLDYNVRARIKGTGPKPEIIPDKPLPMPGADVVVGECSFDDLSGYGLINVWATPGYRYAILGDTGEPLTSQERTTWDIFVKDQYEHEVYPDDEGYFQSEEGGRITFSVPAGGTYKMGGKHPDGEKFQSDQPFQVKAVNKNYWFEYVVPKEGGGGFYRLVIAPACPYSIYKLSAIHSFIHFIDRFERVKPGGDNRVLFSPVNSTLEYVITAQPISLKLTDAPVGDLFSNDIWESNVWYGDISGGDVSGGDAPEGNVSGGDFVIKPPVAPNDFDELTDQDVIRNENGDTITVFGSARQQYRLANPVTNEPLMTWCDVENGKVEFHSLDPATAYLVLTQFPETKSNACVIQPNGVYVSAVKAKAPDDDSKDTPDVHLTLKLFQSINGSDPTILDQTVQFGDSVLYSLAAENYGSENALDIVITDRIPEGMTLKDGSISGGGVYEPVTRTITWHTDLNGGGSDGEPDRNTFQFQVTVDKGSTKTSYNNTAYIEQEDIKRKNTEPDEIKEENAGLKDAGQEEFEPEGAAIDMSNTVHASTSVMTVAKKTDGAYKDPKSIFLFTLWLTPPQGCEIDTDKIVCSDETISFVRENGEYVARFMLKDRQQVKFISLPVGITYRIKENGANLGKYKTTVNDITGSILLDEGEPYGSKGTIPSDGTDMAVYFLNTWRESSALSLGNSDE